MCLLSIGARMQGSKSEDRLNLLGLREISRVFLKGWLVYAPQLNF